MASKGKQATKKSLWQNPVLLICAGIIVIFGVLYYTQRGTSGPKPYEYDPKTNRYWDPNHKHWHNGLPPVAPSALPSGQTAANTPKPYEYNPATNQYWDPGHNHWHNGKPPSPDSQKFLSAAKPVPADTTSHKPYEYDAAKNQYWDPNHKHWHNGQPPNQTLIPPISPGGK